MPDREPIPLTASVVPVDGPEYAAISAWPFADPFVARLLREDIPLRAKFSAGRVWIYRDPGGTTVGFGTLDVCNEYAEFTGGRPHPYIPLLAVNPTIKSLGYGTTIVLHLIAEAALLASRPGACHDLLILDVYTSSTKAIEVYRGCGFTPLTPEPRADPKEAGKPYLVLARPVSVAPG